MEYSGLVEVYEKLDSTSKRLEKTYYISEALKKASDEELEMVVLLLQGRVFSSWQKEKKLGFSDSYMIKAMQRALGAPEHQIKRLWAEKGDLGSVAEILAQKKRQKTLFTRELSVKKVFDNVRRLPGIEGSGSVDRKIHLVSELLSAANPAEAKYIARTVLEILRIGIGSGTIRDAIVWAYLGKKLGVSYKSGDNDFSISDRDEYNAAVEAVQSAYDRLNDFSAVARLASEGLDELKKVETKMFRPLKVMLAQTVEDITQGMEKVGKPSALEFKYDGFRCITGHTPIYTKEKGIFSVKDIKKGMHVLTHKGRFKKITAVNSRTIDKGENVYRIQSSLGHDFKITEGHRVCVSKESGIEWMPIEKITKENRLFFPLIRENFPNPFKEEMLLENSSGYSKRILINNFFFRFLGFWIGDGFTNNFHNTERVGLVFNAKEKNLLAFYKRGLQKNFKLAQLSENNHNGATYLYWRDKPFRIWLSQNFRREWKGKFLPWWFLGINKKQFQAFLQGWLESDGHVDEKGRKSIVTKERDLAMTAQLLGLRHGILLGMKKFRIKGKTYYKIILCKSFREAKFLKNGLSVKIRKIAKVSRPDPRLKVYNLQVEEDESYCTTLFALHNCQIHKKDKVIKIFTRRLEDVTKQFPDVVSQVEKRIKGKEFILDGEAVGYDSKTKKYLPFQSISQRIRRKYNIKEMARDFPVEINIFDILYYEGESFIEKPFRERRGKIENIIDGQDLELRPAHYLETSDEGEARNFYAEAKKKGMEGIMLKNLEAPYKPGSRVGNMVKLKPTMETLDLVIVGAEWGEGKRSGWLTSYHLACLDGSGEMLTIGKVATGIKELADAEGVTFGEMTERLKPLITKQDGRVVSIKPEIVIEVKFNEIQKSPTYSSGYALRFPRLVRVREDKGVEDASSLDLVEQLYEGQKR